MHLKKKLVSVLVFIRNTTITLSAKRSDYFWVQGFTDHTAYLEIQNLQNYYLQLVCSIQAYFVLWSKWNCEF